MRGYVAWDMEFPHRFKLVYGSWSKDSAELGMAAGSARTLLVGMVAAAQRAGRFPAADPERLAFLLLAVTHGAVDLALAGHLSADGKGRAAPEDLAEDLLGYPEAAAPASPGPDCRPATAREVRCPRRGQLSAKCARPSLGGG